MQQISKKKEYKDFEEYVLGSFDNSFHDFSREFERPYQEQSLPSFSEEQPPPLELPKHCYPLGDPRMPTINKYALSRGFSFKLLMEHKFAGCPLGRYKGSLIIPAYQDDTLMFWQARDALNRDYNEFPKYRTPAGYTSNGCLFNINRVSENMTVVICEGVFSALRTGVDAVATFGNKISEKQCLLLKDRGVKSIILCFDPDTWRLPQAMIDRGLVGMKPPIYHAMMQVLDYFEEVRVVKLVGGDPDELGTEKTRKLISEAVHVSDYSDVIKIMM